jgi:histidinol-phosphatase (PHP family)
VRRAIERGLGEIGFSDHNPMPNGFDADWRMEEREFPTYLDMVRDVRARFPKFSIKLGLEADYHPGSEAYVAETVKRADFDYVIGSVHYIGDWPMDNQAHVKEYEKRDITDVWRDYFGLVTKLAETRIYDILGHFDVVKKFGHRPPGNVDAIVEPALAAVARAGMALDINTSGLRRPAKEIYPGPRILEMARGMGIAVTLGSDAHEPRHVGEDFEAAVSLLKSAGYREIQRFTRRKREPVAL